MKNAKSLVLSAVALSVASWVGYSFYQAYQPQPVRLQGQIESQQYSISSKVPGRIDQILVRKGQTIEKGDLVFTLHSPEIEAKLEQAKAGEKAADALAMEAEKGARSQQIQAAKDQWLKAKAAASLMEKTYLRVNNLYNEGVVAEQNVMRRKRNGMRPSIPKAQLFRCINSLVKVCAVKQIGRAHV